ncbi:kinase-like domain-containing protein [Lyophyllum atratum]|nr:kinase-like domain-containing protein [Lyophyllum atratum]
MSSKTPPRLQLGKRIDHDSLEFVEVLGVGGYGIVYRAVETNVTNPHSYAVKCLLHSKEQPPIRRQFHIREIALHQISCAHPGVVTLHRVIEDYDYTYIIMDYTPDQDLFTQILNHSRYLGNDLLIRHVFLQLVDAVEYCHSLGIYHRDLKPENVLCFESGCRVAITDFGLATTEKMSEELHTGSIYHMSPECQGGAFALEGSYSPMSNDIWSLGIILLNLATGRNPWRTATTEDLTFQAYLRNPLTFFPSVLPVSLEINDILVQMLHVDWRQRITLAELRQQMEDVTSIYAADVVFEGSQARCAWEARMDVERVSCIAIEDEHKAAPVEGMKSFWSEDSCSEVNVTNPTAPDPGARAFSYQPTDPGILDPNEMQLDRQDSWDSSDSSYYSYSTSPSTPADRTFGNVRMGELTMEDIYEQQPELGSTSTGLSAMDTGERLKAPTHASQFPRSPGPASDTWMHEPNDSYSTTVGGSAASSWASPETHISSLPSTDSESDYTSEITFARSTTLSLSLNTFGGPAQYSRSSAESELSPENHDNKVMFNPMKFFSRPSLFSSSAPKDSPCQHRTSGDSWPSQTCNLQPVQTAPGLSQTVEGAPQPETQKEGESRWKISRFGPTRHWFSPGKLF